MTYRIEPLPLARFAPLMAMDDDTLAAIGARRMFAQRPHASPCRVSLVDGSPGEALILVNHEHLADPSSPYRGSGPVFVRQGAVEATPAPGEIPAMLERRLLSVRVYDAAAMMTAADVVQGADLSARLAAWFAEPATDQIHIHTAARGCYLARAVRAGPGG